MTEFPSFGQMTLTKMTEPSGLVAVGGLHFLGGPMTAAGIRQELYHRASHDSVVPSILNSTVALAVFSPVFMAFVTTQVYIPLSSNLTSDNANLCPVEEFLPTCCHW